MKIAVVTGASSGMGRECILQISKRFKGLDEIWVIARRKDRLLELEKKVSQNLRIFDLDLTDKDSLSRLTRVLMEKNPDVKMLVNAAGYGKIGTFTSLSLEDTTGMVSLNCEALCAVTHIVLNYMSHNARIIMFASSAAFLPQPGFNVYAATKAFVLSFSRALSEELKPRQITVTAVCPGPVKTEFFDIAEQTGEVAVYKKLLMANPQKVVKKAMNDSMIGKKVSVYGISMQMFYILCKVFPHELILKCYDFINTKLSS